MKKFYLKTDNDGTVLDVITYQYEGYTLYEAERLPIGVNGGWWKLENGQLVEYTELRPKNENEELIEKIKVLDDAIYDLAFKVAMTNIK